MVASLHTVSCQREEKGFETLIEWELRRARAPEIAAPKSFGVRIRLVGEVEKPGLDPFGIDIEEPVQARRDHGNRVMPMIRREREQLVESAPPGSGSTRSGREICLGRIF